jgi:RNA recognition motif-containing protein
MRDDSVKRALDFAARTTHSLYQSHPELRRQEALQRTMAANLSIFHRVYVGSVHFEVTEIEVTNLFSVFGPIKSVQMIVDQTVAIHPKHKGYGFIDFEVPEAAELACRADGLEVAHRPIKIGRPANFPTDLPPGVPRPPANRIYMGNVHSSISESELSNLLSTVGPVKCCRLAPDTAALKPIHRGFGYAEFERVADAVTAATLLNNFEIAGRKLAVSKAIVGGPMIDGMENILKRAQEAAKILVIVLRDIVDQLEVVTEQQRNELTSDCVSECAKFGAVIDHHLIVDGNSVNFFVHYKDEAAGQNAIKTLNGRWFGGRQLTVQGFDLDRYTMRDFSIPG